jgi:hypothetical protein
VGESLAAAILLRKKVLDGVRERWMTDIVQQGS